MSTFVFFKFNQYQSSLRLAFYEAAVRLMPVVGDVVEGEYIATSPCWKFLDWFILYHMLQLGYNWSFTLKNKLERKNVCLLLWFFPGIHYDLIFSLRSVSQWFSGDDNVSWFRLNVQNVDFFVFWFQISEIKFYIVGLFYFCIYICIRHNYSLTRLGLDTCDLLALVCYSVMVGFILEVVWIFFGLVFCTWPLSYIFLEYPRGYQVPFYPVLFFFYFDLYWPFRRLLSSLPYFMLVLSVVTYFLLHTCISLLFFCDFSRSLSLCL